MTDKSILIIGAGFAGLCTGIYAQMNGYQTRILEQHKIPGGLVTAWRRNGYLIDLCIHWLAGSGPGIHLHRYWKEVRLLEGRKFTHYDRYGAYHAKDGRVVVFYCDPNRLEKHLLELSPQDAPVIHELAEGVRLGIRFKSPEMEQYESGRLAWMKYVFSQLPNLREVLRWTKLTVGELAQRFHSPLLREALLTLWEPEFSVFFMICAQLGYLYKRQAGYPLGGSLPLALTLEKRYKQLGGQVQYRTRVEKILVENGHAVGVRCEDGSEHRADVVVSAADGYTTIFKLLEGKFVDQQIQERYASWKPMQSVIYVSAGVKRTFPGIPSAVEGNAYELLKPVVIAGKTHQAIGIRIHNDDPCFAPTGKTVLTSAIFTDHAHWESLAKDPKAYAIEKEAVACAYLEALEQIWPGISAQVEMCNVATPATFERITSTWKASITGWILTPQQAMAKIPKTLPGLDHFWMVGQWVCPGGGLPSGVSTGREVIWRQCREDHRQFVTTE